MVEVSRVEMIDWFCRAREWWTPLGEYYAPGDGGQTYNNLTKEFYSFLGWTAPDSLLECTPEDPNGKAE
jgi:hypothetical protein